MVTAVGTVTWSVAMSSRHYQQLSTWLLRPDRDEHAAFLICGLARHPSASRLLVRTVLPVADADFSVADGHYRISPAAVARAARVASDAGMCVVWAHSHPGAGPRTSLSHQDLRTHEAALPALADMTDGRPVAALVLSERGAAGVVSLAGPDGSRLDQPISHVRVVGTRVTDLAPAVADFDTAPERFNRQVRLFGPIGQTILRRLVVAVVGVGGGGSLIVQMLAHLGVGTIVLLDFDTVDESNLSRIVGATPTDAQRRAPKIEVAARLVATIDPSIEVVSVSGDIRTQSDARRLAEADFVFLATDTVFARYAFNIVCHQYLIPGVQIGAKVSSAQDGSIATMHVVERPIDFANGCLDCAGAIPPEQLRVEQLSQTERRAQRYVDTGQDEEPLQEASVISLNSISASLAVTDFLFQFTGLLDDGRPLDPAVYYPLERTMRRRISNPRTGCTTCDADGYQTAYAQGDLWPLPLRPNKSTASHEAHGEKASSWWRRPLWESAAALLHRVRGL